MSDEQKKKDISEKNEKEPPLTPEQEKAASSLGGEYFEECKKLAESFEDKFKQVGLKKTDIAKIFAMYHARIIGSIISAKLISYLNEKNLQGLTTPELLGYLGINQRNVNYFIQESFFEILEKVGGFDREKMMIDIIDILKMDDNSDESSGGHC